MNTVMLTRIFNSFLNNIKRTPGLYFVINGNYTFDYLCNMNDFVNFNCVVFILPLYKKIKSDFVLFIYFSDFLLLVHYVDLLSFCILFINYCTY